MTTQDNHKKKLQCLGFFLLLFLTLLRYRLSRLLQWKEFTESYIVLINRGERILRIEIESLVA